MIGAGAIGAFLASCSTLTVREICSTRFPELEHRLSEAALALGPWQPGPWQSDGTPSRGLASVPEMAPRDRELWERWALQRLEETQRYLDVTTGEPQMKLLRETLNRAAIDLVEFNGYARAGRGDRMVATLRRIQDSSRQAQSVACEQAAKL